MQTSKLLSIELEFREGSSDKVYQAAVQTSGDGFVVNFAYGRRGATLKTGTKTSQTVTYDEAVSIYEKLVRSKTSKGYKPIGTGQSIVATPDAGRDTGLRPQLLNAVDEQEAEAFLGDPDWCVQEKFDGRRVLLIKGNGGAFAAANRKGMLIACPEVVKAALAGVPDGFVIDGELVGEHFHAFDLLVRHNKNLRGRPYGERLNMLVALLGENTSKFVAVVPTVFGVSAKRAYVDNLRSSGKEGVVFKDLLASWNTGKPASGGSALKLKFWETCSCVVIKVNGKRSVELALSGCSVGNVTIPINHNVPENGQVVEIRYLYVTGPGGALYQPIYLGERNDVEIAECTFERQCLKYKQAA